jgi:hypothetical protein
MHQLKTKTIQICIQYTHGVQSVASSRRLPSYVPIHMSLQVRFCLVRSFTLLFRKVWNSAQEIPLKLYCRNRSPLSLLVNVFLSLSTGLASMRKHALRLHYEWERQGIIVKSWIILSGAQHFFGFQNIYSTSGVLANWWTLCHWEITNNQNRLHSNKLKNTRTEFWGRKLGYVGRKEDVC